MPRYRVTITGRDYNAMADLVREHGVAVVRQTAQDRRADTGGYSVDALLDQDQVAALEARGYRVITHEDVDAAGKARQKEVGKGDRYAARLAP